MPPSSFRIMLRLTTIAPLLLAAGHIAWRGSAEGKGAGPGAEGEGSPGRTPWTTSRVSGSPDPPPPFAVVRAFPGLKFEHPLLIARVPGSDRFVVGEQSGVLHSFADGPDARAEPFADLPGELETVHLLDGAEGVEAVYGLAFHPDFERNRHCFVSYTLRGSDPRRPNLPDGTRVSRFEVTRTDPPRIDPSTEVIILSFLQGGHNGGDLRFGPDGMLYISSGDAASPNPPDPFNTGQDISDLLSSILRIDVDRTAEGKNYAIPADNPFVAVEGARPEVWAYGLRNPWRMSFDRETGELFVGDVGWELWESVHRVEKGGNYGWSAMEGPQPIKSGQVGPTPIHPPLIELPHSIACSVTGGLVYRGGRFPELRGAYVFGDWETRRLWAARFDGDRTTEMTEIARPSVRFVAFCEDREGELYFLDQEEGTVHTLERDEGAAGAADFPTTLSETGLFASVEDHEPAEGVVPYDVNSPQWLDGATAERWVAFPGDSSATFYEDGKPIPGLVSWHSFRMHFPKDAVLVRTLSLGGRRLETQLLHYDGVDWRAYTFAWRSDQSDADLVPSEGGELELPGEGPGRVWQFPSRSQCMSCHSNQSDYALAFLPEQLNRPGHDGRNQLVALTEAGLIRRADDEDGTLPPFDDESAASEPRLADPTDEGQPIEARALSYLHANCGHCHSEHGGGAVPLRLKSPTPVDGMNAVGIPPTRGDFGLPDARIIAPGDPYASTLYFRMAKFGRDRMPHIGSERPHEQGLDLVARWITQLGSSEGGEGGSPGGDAPGRDLARPSDAMRLAREVGRGELAPPDRDAVMSEAAGLPAGPIRELFEGYLPSKGGAGRTLGSVARPRAVLSLDGDPARGEELFWSQPVQCGTCHRIGDRGTPVGPDLSNIGAIRSREDLLDSLLEPSRRIEPKFASYAAATTDGRFVTGLLVDRDEHAVVLRDGQGKQVVLPADEVEELRPSLVSLMPDGQLADLTAQQAADLLAYLESLR
ncbi:Soluble aldose sugar dehydrogenase YliI precursor [Tautonia plasticadhaerens]|uniref:Soluble aldose sugar dehydrogenase YliI n=2 Tax=Tautonia plasticadhaerens TaxID=2527974 RepID=A0A518HBI2_9BACT|nr:Soluble aldose sugar dehydrogenase YliI precursor [Tautonia plasticadhaerens]